MRTPALEDPSSEQTSLCYGSPVLSPPRRREGFKSDSSLIHLIEKLHSEGAPSNDSEASRLKQEKKKSRLALFTLPVEESSHASFRPCSSPRRPSADSMHG